MAGKPDFENRNRVSIYQRLGMQELEKINVSESRVTSSSCDKDPVAGSSCPDHPLGQDLFFVLWNAHRS